MKLKKVTAENMYFTKTVSIGTEPFSSWLMPALGARLSTRGLHGYRMEASSGACMGASVHGGFIKHTNINRCRATTKQLAIRAGIYWNESHARTCDICSLAQLMHGVYTTGTGRLANIHIFPVCPICSLLSPGSTSRDTARRILAGE